MTMIASDRLLPVLTADAPAPERVRQAVEHVYARPEFNPGQVMTPPRWLEELLSWLFGWLGVTQPLAQVLFYSSLVFCTVLLLALLAYVAWSARRVLVMSRRRGGQSLAAQLREGQSQAYWEEARQRAAAGDFTEAIRFLFLSLVYRFDETGRVSFQQAYTNHEYLGLFGDRPALRDPLEVFVSTLDDHWYGQRPAEQRQYDQCLTLYHTLTHN